MFLAMMLCLAGCGGKDNKDTQAEQNQSEGEEKNELYMIIEHDSIDEFFLLRSIDTGLDIYVEYGFSTHFRDKYGNYTTALPFTPGRIVTLGGKDEEGYLKEVQLSNAVWEQEKVKRFSIDTEKGVFTIADTRYSIRDKVVIFSNGTRVPFSSISEEDVLRIVGIDKKILSITVTTGHGTLALRNTDLFTDSFVQLNTNIFAMIIGDMDMELPEGKYTLKVANDGWGGTTEIEIKRGDTTEIDLDTLKGEGKKKGMITFDIDVENLEDVEVCVDYEKVDHMKPVEITYGTHVLEIKAEGYVSWKKYLFVNSEEATIEIELEEDDEDDSEDEDEDENTEDSEEEESESSEDTESAENSESTESEVSENSEITDTESTENPENTDTEVSENSEITESEG